MIIKGGTAYINAGGLNLASEAEQTISGLYEEMLICLTSGKPVIIDIAGVTPAAAVLHAGESAIIADITGYSISVTSADVTTVTASGGSTVESRFTVPALPDGYQEVEYLSTDEGAEGHPYVKVEISLAVNDCIECGYDGIKTILGCDSAWNFNINDDYTPLPYGAGGFGLSTRLFAAPSEGSCGTFLIQFSTVGSATYFNYGLWRTDNSYVYNGNLGRLYIYHGLTYGIYPNEDDTLIAALVPCYNKTTNVAGFYDVINEDFLTAPEGRTFGVGPDVN